jgi:hypothetical protein
LWKSRILLKRSPGSDRRSEPSRRKRSLPSRTLPPFSSGSDRLGLWK